MDSFKVSRRNMLLGTGASLASLAVAGQAQVAPKAAGERDPYPVAATPDQIRRMEWWHAAKFGMFIHFGLYSLHERHEWAMENEAIPIAEYQALAPQVQSKAGFCAGSGPSWPKRQA